MRQVLPNMFCNEWHKWMQQFKHMTQDCYKQILYSATIAFISIAIQTRFCKFNVPVAICIPNEIIYGASRFTKLKFIKICSNTCYSFIVFFHNPFVSQCQISLSRNETFIIIRQIHENEFRSIPNFIGKVAVCFYTFHVETHIIARCITCYKCKAQCISTIFADYI